jgi:putative membrane-bound dehydrogenase-like protein
MSLNLDFATVLGTNLPIFGIVWVLLGVFLIIRRPQQRFMGVLLAAAGIACAAVYTYLAVGIGGRSPISLNLEELANNFTQSLVAFLLAAVLVYLVYQLARRVGGKSSLGVAIICIIGIAIYTAAVISWLAANVEPEVIYVRDPNLTLTVFDQAVVRAPTAMALGPNNELYVAGFGGRIWVLQDENDDGTADTSVEFAQGLVQPEGLAWYEDGLYVNEVGRLLFLQDTDGDYVADETQVIFDQFPTKEELHPNHQNNGVAVGPDGRIYVGSGSTTDRFEEEHPYAAGIFSMNPDGSDVRTYATGLRNPFTFVPAPEGGFFVVDNGSSGCITDISEKDMSEGELNCENTIYVPEEVNFVTEGGDYGFPHEFGIPAADSDTIPPMVTFAEHGATTGIVLYEGDQMPAYQGQLFVSFWSASQIYTVRFYKIDELHYTGDTRLMIQGIVGPTAMINAPDGGIFIASYFEHTIYHLGA